VRTKGNDEAALEQGGAHHGGRIRDGQGDAERFASEGAQVIVSDIDEAAANRTVEAIVNNGGKASATVST
jgi:hypothetical protein